jgi:hypothetical protein
VHDRGAQAIAHSAARCALQVLGRGAQAVARGAAALSRQKKNDSEIFQRSNVNFTDFLCTLAR